MKRMVVVNIILIWFYCDHAFCIFSNITESTYTIESLNPGVLYTISMVTVSSGVYSETISTVVVTGKYDII